MAKTATAEAPRARRGEKVQVGKAPGGARWWLAIAFLAPAAVALGAIVVYPTIDTIFQSFQNADRQWVGLENYADLVQRERIRQAIQNNAIWVLTAPAIITALGLMFAILTERIRYATAIKVIVFMPMAISFLATGIIWRLVYETDPERGLLNAAGATVVNTVQGGGNYPNARPSQPDALTPGGEGFVTKQSVNAGEVATIGLTAIAPDDMPEEARQAAEPRVGSNEVGVVVWRDFRPGGSEPGVIEEQEVGLPGVEVALLSQGGDVVATEATDERGVAVFDAEGGGPFQARIAKQTFTEAYGGVCWLCPGLVTPAIIAAFSWMWAGFAVVVIGAGLAALPRDVLEAARVDGASEWQTFRYVTLPLLSPVLGVVFITMVINVLKIFDIVLVMAPGQSIDEANVIALEMWKTAFTSRQYGLGAAVAVVLFLLVIPVMILNIKRFRRES